MAVGLLVGCGASEPLGEATPRPVPLRVDVATQVVTSGEYHFVFDESPGVADKIRKRCEVAANVESCVDRIRQASQGEGMRIVHVDDAGARLQSFGVEDGVEKVYLEVLFRVDSIDGDVAHVHAEPSRPGGGLRGAFTIQVIDARTIALQDAKDGREVFRLNR